MSHSHKLFSRPIANEYHEACKSNRELTKFFLKLCTTSEGRIYWDAAHAKLKNFASESNLDFLLAYIKFEKAPNKLKAWSDLYEKWINIDIRSKFISHPKINPNGEKNQLLKMLNEIIVSSQELDMDFDSIRVTHKWTAKAVLRHVLYDVIGYLTQGHYALAETFKKVAATSTASKETKNDSKLKKKNEKKEKSEKTSSGKTLTK